MAAYQHMNDGELAALLNQEDELAFAEIYRRHVAGLIRFAESKLYSMEDARDIVHDLFTSLWSDRRTIVIDGSFRSWLFAAARYRVIDKIRKNVVREEYSSKMRDLSPAFHSLEEELNARELQARIDLRLGELPKKTQDIYIKSRQENKSIQEIADELDIPRQTVKNQISIALKHLRSALGNFLLTLF